MNIYILQLKSLLDSFHTFILNQRRDITKFVQYSVMNIFNEW